MALLRAALCRDGVARRRADAQLAQQLLEPGDPARGPALHLEGTSYLLTAQADRADQILIHTVEVALHDREMNAASYGLAQRSLVAIERQEWQQAESLAGQALAVVRDGHLVDYVTTALVEAVVARTALRQARTSCSCGPTSAPSPSRPSSCRRRWTQSPAAVAGASSLTTAELRLLPLRSTRLTFRQIGERLHLSRHTVKSQAPRSTTSSASPRGTRRLSARSGPSCCHSAPRPPRLRWASAWGQPVAGDAAYAAGGLAPAVRRSRGRRRHPGEGRRGGG